jgi:hypothetical protein
MLKSILFILPIAFFGIGTIIAVQDALGFSDSVRELLNYALLAIALLAEDQYGPSSFERKREGRS